MEVLTGEQMRRVDRRAIESMGIASLELMEAAGRGIAQLLLRDFPEARSKGVVILCGKGNNGGDGLAASRYLAREGVTPRVILLASADELKGDAAVNLRRAREMGIQIEQIADECAWENGRSGIEGNAIILDAMLGTGVRGGARGLVAKVIERLNGSRATVVSVDLPTGIDADTREVVGLAVRADRTYTLCRPKLPLVQQPAASHAGSWSVVPIGIPDEAVAAENPSLEWLDTGVARRLLPPLPVDAHKGTFGHLLVVAGSRGKSGAAVLVARGALRSGVGLVTVGTPASVQPTVAVQQAEVMTEPLPEKRGALSRTAPAAVLRHLASRDALAIGPGLGTSSETSIAVQAIVARRQCPAVLDADGLNAYASNGRKAAGGLRAGAHPLVLTPHPGEAARLLRGTVASVQEDRLESALRLARDTESVVVLKGHHSVVASPQGAAAVNSTGNPGMATGGTGDVLTGIVGALLARGLGGYDAARLAVHAHGDAGDRAARDRGADGMTAQDLLDHLPRTFKELRGGGSVRW